MAKRSGPNIPDAQRHTSRIVLRLPPDRADRIRAHAAQEGKTISAVVADAVDHVLATRIGAR